MALPLLVAGSLAMGSVYSVGKAYDSVRYWNDYRRATGFSPKYPFRSGSFDYLRTGASIVGYGALKNLSGRRRNFYIKNYHNYHYHYR